MIVDTRGTQAPCTAALGEIAQGGGRLQAYIRYACRRSKFAAKHAVES